MSPQPHLDPSLPGQDLVAEGLADLEHDRETAAALLVSMAAPRLRGVGVEVPRRRIPSPSHRLYDLLAETEGDGAHGRYNALVRRLVSFAHAAERATAS